MKKAANAAPWKNPVTKKVVPEVADDVETEVFGVVFAVAAEDILASREYDDRVVIVTVDGRKIEGAKAQ